MSVMWRNFPLAEVIMPSNKASSDAGPELASRESHEAMESPEALMCPLEKGVRGIKQVVIRRPAGSGYLRQQIRGGRKGRAERKGLGQSPNKIARLGGLR